MSAHSQSRSTRSAAGKTKSKKDALLPVLTQSNPTSIFKNHFSGNPGYHVARQSFPSGRLTLTVLESETSLSLAGDASPISHPRPPLVSPFHTFPTTHKPTISVRVNKEGVPALVASENTPRTSEVNPGFPTLLREPQSEEVRFSTTGLTLYPEFLLYTFHIEECPRRLLFFLLFSELNPKTLLFTWNKEVKERFLHYCLSVHTQAYEPRTVKDALGNLRGYRIVQEVMRGLYMLNPVLAGNSSLSERRELIKTYAQLARSRRGTSSDIYIPTLTS